MRFAIITVTKNGQKLADNIVSILKNDPTILSVDVFHKNVKNTLEMHFNEYDCWIGIMATGIMVRLICPLIKSKLNDPAVLIADENSKHMISLLSGHIGGANSFATKIAGVIGAVPVITTATDLNGKMGIDSLANYLWLEICQTTLIKSFNQHIADDGKIDIYLPFSFDYLTNHPMISRSYNLHFWNEDFIRALLSEYSMDLKPRRMVAGIGSKKGVSEEQVFFAIRSALQHLHIHLQRLDALATADIKKEETGIKLAAEKSELPLEIVPLNVIKGFHHPDCTPSDFVESKFGVSGISEPAALIQAGSQSQLILKKTASNGVTVAIAVAGCTFKNHIKND